MRQINGKHYYAKISSQVEEVCLDRELSIPENELYLVVSLQKMLNHILETGRSASMLLEAEYVTQSSIIMRSFFETVINFTFIISDKNLFSQRMNYYLGNTDHLNKFTADLRVIFNKERDKVKAYEQELFEEHQKDIKALGISEDLLIKDPSFINKIDDFGLRAYYLLYYRKFSKYVHGSCEIVFTDTNSDYRNLINDIYVCGCFCWTLLFGSLNEFCNLNMSKKYNSLTKDFRKVFKYYLPK